MAHRYNSCLTEMLERFLWACAQHREHVELNSGCTGGFEEWAVIAGDSEADAGGGGVGKIASAPRCFA